MRLRILGLERLTPLQVVRRTLRQTREDDVLTYAAALAYSGLLSIFPFLVFLLALLTYLESPQILQALLVWAGELLPSQSLERISQVLQESRGAVSAGLLWLGALGAVWAASGGVRSAMTVLNHAYDVPESRGTGRRFLLSLAYTMGLGLLVPVAAALLLLGPRAAEWAVEHLGIAESSVAWWSWVRYPMAIVLLIVAGGVTYSLLPSQRPFRLISPGAVLAVLLWIVLSIGFRLYVENFGRYNVLYGSVGAVIVLLLYLWICSVVLLVGGEVNSVIDRAGAERSLPRLRR